jgi:hypothetical protein
MWRHSIGSGVPYPLVALMVDMGYIIVDQVCVERRRDVGGVGGFLGGLWESLLSIYRRSRPLIG